MNNTQKHQYLEGARRYANADKSDPFAYYRAVAHMTIGLAESMERPGYDAEAFEITETRMIDGHEVSFKVPAFKNVARL